MRLAATSWSLSSTAGLASGLHQVQQNSNHHKLRAPENSKKCLLKGKRRCRRNRRNKRFDSYLANVACKGYESKFKSTLSESVTNSIPSLRSSTASCTSTTSSNSVSLYRKYLLFLNPRLYIRIRRKCGVMIRNLTSTKLPSDSVKIPALFHRSPTSFVSFSFGSALRC